MSDFKPHPYADAWPMMPDDEIAELAEDIAANGLREPVVMYDGMILDGRNRYAACEIACIEPAFREFDGDDDGALAFVQSVNNERRHQSKGSRAASWALSMLAAQKRGDGRWAYGGAKGQDVDLHKQWRSMLGTIADFAPELLLDVRSDALTLNAAFEQAREVKDAEDRRLADAAREAKAEADAKTDIESKDPKLAARVGKGDIETYREALAIWQQRNKEAAEKERRVQAEHAAAVRRLADYIKAFLAGVHTAAHLAEDELRDEVLAALAATERERFLRIEKEATWPTTI